MSFTSTRYFPVFLNLKGMRILVVGGGKVGTKRALKFTEYGADVTVLSLA
ncbi:MAG: NAD(P)-dependent oxidoreductase, partial [Metallosphaera sp.]